MESGSGFQFRIPVPDSYFRRSSDHPGLGGNKTVGREGLQSVLFVAVTNPVGPCGSVAKTWKSNFADEECDAICAVFKI